VARWFVEREGGNKIVNYLVILGTPSAGSPWSTVQQWFTLGVGLALNSLTTVAWPVKVFSGLISAFEKIDVTLDQFQPGSEFLQSLAASPDPHVRYNPDCGQHVHHPFRTSGGARPDGQPVETVSDQIGLRTGLAGLFQAAQ